MGAWRRGLCVAAATSRRDAVEHRRRTAGECGAISSVFNRLVDRIFSRLDENHAKRLPVCNDALVYQHYFTRFQHAAGLSARRRPNPAIAALVRVWSGTELDDRDSHRLYRRNRPDRICILGTINLAWHPVRFYSIELLGRLEAGARLGPYRQNTATRRLCLSSLQNRATPRRIVGVRQMPETF